MAPILISVFVFAGLLGFILYLGYRFYARPGRVYEQLGGPASVGMPQIDRTQQGDLNVVVTLIEQLGHIVPVGEEDESAVRHDLFAAGYRSENAVWIYFGLRVLSVIAILGLALIFRSSITSNPVLSIVIPVAAGCLGWFGPSFMLDYLVSARQQRIREGLPDTLDLIVVCVEAGLALDRAAWHVQSCEIDGRAISDISREVELETI